MTDLVSKPTNKYVMYGDGGYKYPWTLDEIGLGLRLFIENNNGKMPVVIAMNEKDILQMGKIKYKGTLDYLRGIKYKGQKVLVIPLKTNLRGTIGFYY